MAGLLEAALQYAERGFAVFPLRPKSKLPITEHGFKDATKDPALIRRWWEKWPTANVGIATGAVSGVVVIDVDPRNGGNESLRDLQLKHEMLPMSLVAQTCGKGKHIYLQQSNGQAFQSRAGALGRGLDVKADGGYVVAPPSYVVQPPKDGKPGYEGPYKWLFDDGAPAPMADWLPAEMVKSAHKVANQDRCAWVELIRGPIGEGVRNDTLARLAGHLSRIRVLDPAIAAELVHAVNEARCQPALTRGEVEAIVQSIAAREAARLREGRK